MTTKPNPNQPWADEPYKLIPTPVKKLQTIPNPLPANILCATEMALAHNGILRGLNSIMQQAPHIPSSPSPSFSRVDVADLLTFTLALVATTHHHHHSEESTMFPLLTKLSGREDFAERALAQHKAFDKGLVELEEYCKGMKGREEEWRWSAMKVIIDSFGDELTTHLTEEIELMLALDEFDDAEVRRVWAETERVAKASGNLGMLYEIFPCALGACDKTFEGGNTFPPLPGLVPYAIKYWFGGRHKGAWRFNCCDWWGRPVPLYFLPDNRAV